MKFRLIALILAAAMLILLIPSCGKAELTKPENVFRETKIALPDDLGSRYNINRYIRSSDTLYMLVYNYDDNYNASYFILPLDLTSGTIGERINIELEQSDNGGSSLNTFAVAPDGTLYLMVEIYSYGDMGYQQTSELRRIKDGVTDSIDLGSLADEETGEQFYVSTMNATEDGSILLTSWNGMRMITPDGKIKKIEIEMDNMQVEGMQEIGGKLYAQVWVYDENYSGSKMLEFDPVTATFGEELAINSRDYYNLIFGPGYDYYYNDASSVWGMTAGSDDMTEVLNFVNSDINANDIRQLIPLSADRFFASSTSYDGGQSTTTLMFLDRVPEDQIVEKKMLRLAVNYVNYDLRRRIIEFNKSNDEYRISIDDYSRYNTQENYNAGTEKLNTDIISGNIPDIFMIDAETPYATYASKGIFADLYELMDADESFDRSKYLENIFKAYEYDGELLSLVPSVHISTFAAKPELLEGRESWTMQEFMEFAKAHPDISMFDYEFNRERFMEMCLMFARDQFIDKETGKTYFDSDEFRAILEFAKSMPEEDFWSSMSGEDYTQEFYEEYENRFVDERVLLATWSLYDIQYSYKDLLNYSLKSDATLIGFPVNEGNGAVIQANYEYAISRRSDFKEGAWEFLKTLISEEAQMPIYNDEYDYWEYSLYDVPIYKPALEKALEIAMTPPETDDQIIDGGVVMPMPMPMPREEKIVFAETTAAVSAETEAIEDVIISDDIIIDDDIYIEEIPIEPGIDPWVDPYSIPLTQAQVDKILALINGTTQVYRYDEKLQAIIWEEASSYFAGTKTLDATVDIIQNRAGIYVNESR